MTVGGNIRMIRELRGLSCNALAKKAGTSHTYIGDIEKGKSSPTTDMLFAIARALGVPVEWFFEGVEEVPEANGSTEEVEVTTISIEVPVDRESWFKQRALYELRLQYRDPLAAMSEHAAARELELQPA